MKIIENNKNRGVLLYDTMCGRHVDVHETCGRRPLRSFFDCLAIAVLTVITVIFCLLVSVNALAQSGDTANKNKLLIHHSRPASDSKTMIILDDGIFNVP